MAELKKFDNTHEIHVDLCMTLAKHGAEFQTTNDLGEMAGFCNECGHPIRYEQIFLDIETDEEYVLGSDCMFKIYVFKYWKEQIEEKDIENKDLQRAGKWLWIINRDHYTDRIEGRLPQPNDCENYKELADKLKNLVFKIRREIKTENEAKKMSQMEKKSEERAKNWFEDNNFDLDQCNEFEKDFLASMYKCYINGWTLSEKQQITFDKIKIKFSGETQVQEQTATKTDLDLMISSINDRFDELNSWEKEFMNSITEKQSYSGSLNHNTTYKQREVIERISGDLSKKVKQNEYVGRQTKTWIISQLTGDWNVGTILSVVRTSEKAILCDVEANGQTLVEVWIPKSQLSEEVEL